MLVHEFIRQVTDSILLLGAHINTPISLVTKPKFTQRVVVSLQVEGTHFWEGCNIPEVEYLKHPHRHVFHIKVWKRVKHDDREVEIIRLKHQIQDYLTKTYCDFDLKLCNFQGRSCEMIAEELASVFELDACEVLEDNENGALIQKNILWENI